MGQPLLNSPSKITEWLNQHPDASEIKSNDDGSKYLPIEYVKPLLDLLGWDTTNFNHQFLQLPSFDENGNQNGMDLWVSGSVELHIKNENLKRTITGGATFNAQRYYPNTNWAATCLSLCIVSAAKELGPLLGKDLNKDLRTVPTSAKQIAPVDDKVKKSLNNLMSKK